ncbi:MAG: radical SAM protein [Candidatus Lokiarchaeota archaeon]|nr:radical SAM protein [Candidatus Lokiarchaeota archaeon]
MVFRLLRPDSEIVWKNNLIRKRFARYRNIIDDKEIARFIIAKSLKAEYDSNDTIEDLEKLIKEKSSEFNELLKNPIQDIKNRTITSKNYINLAEELALRYLENCNFCERQCSVNRANGETGFCLISKDSYVSSAFLHTGEEAPLIPSGTIFFQGCNFSCVFCQNFDISQSWKNKRNIEDIAQKVDVKQLAALANRLVEKGAININYVGGDPIPNLHTIVGNLQYQTTNITQLWNSNFFLTDRSLSLIIDLIDFWLPDWKYGNNKCGKKYSGIDNYFDVIARNHKRIHNEGSGEIIIRHLVMPNHIECCSKPILDYVAKELPNAVVNLMGQYRPEYLSRNYEEINRRPSMEEINEVKYYADDLGILYEPVS